MTAILPKVSDANHWMKCHGSVQAQAQFPALPGEVSQSRLEGRACHEVAKKLLTAERHGWPLPELVGTLSADGILITQEFHDVAREYVDTIMGHIRSSGVNPFLLHIEDRVSLDHILPKWYGTPDAHMWDTSLNELHVWDAKFGHTPVDPFEHWQMIIYAIGAIHDLGEKDIHLRVKQIVLHVIQPRSFHSGGTHRQWSFPIEQLEHYKQLLRDALADVTGDSPSCTVGPQCKNCTARAHCDTLKAECYAGMDMVGELATHDLHGHALGVELKLVRRAVAAMEARLSGLEEQAIHEIKSGTPVTFFGTKQGYGRERWKKETPHGEIIMMGDLMGVDLRKPVELDTPAQARKKGVDESVIAAYSETPMTAIKLVEVDRTEARQVFTRNEG